MLCVVYEGLTLFSLVGEDLESGILHLISEHLAISTDHIPGIIISLTLTFTILQHKRFAKLLSFDLTFSTAIFCELKHFGVGILRY